MQIFILYGGYLSVKHYPKKQKILVIAPNAVNPDYRISKSALMLSELGEVTLLKCLKASEKELYRSNKFYKEVSLKPVIINDSIKKRVLKAIGKFKKIK